MARKYSKVAEYLMLTLAMPLVVIYEFLEFSQDLSLAMTGGKYSGRGSLSRGRRRYWDEDDGTLDWMRPSDYDKKRFNKIVDREVGRQIMAKRIGSDGRPELVLTNEGRKQVWKKFPLFRLAKRRWRGRWLVVAFDIPEGQRIDRDKIRDQLLGLGFVQWQKSVYVSPHDIADDLAALLKQNRLEKMVVPMIAKRILTGSDWEFARSLFHIDQIREEYLKIEKNLQAAEKSGKINLKFWKRQFAAYLEVLRRDPFLPVGLGPKDGYGREAAIKTLHEYVRKIH